LTATHDAGGCVLVVDDDRELRLRIARALRSAGLAPQTASSGRKAIEAARTYRPAVLLLEIELPDVSGYEVCHRLRQEFGREMTIFLVSAEPTKRHDRDAALLVGADNCFAKPVDVDELVAHVRRAFEPFNSATVVVDLTERERDVLKLLSEGLGEKRIADELFIAPKTVATHIQHILPKLGVHSRAEAVAFAHRHGLFGRPSFE
jgi:DNA-binding NarL/FixJ family response regulator